MNALEFINKLPRAMTKEEKALAKDDLRKLFVDEMDKSFPDWNKDYVYTKTGMLGADATGEALLIDEEYKKANELIDKIELLSEEQVAERKKAEQYEKEAKGIVRDSFGKVIDNLVAEYIKLSNEIVREKEIYDKQWAKDKATGNYTDQYFAEMKANYEEKENELIGKIKNAQNEARKSLLLSTGEFYSIDPKLVDTDFVTLVNSGIKFEENDIKSLSLRYKSNPTMLRVLYSHTDKKTSEKFKYDISGKEEMKILDGFISYTAGMASNSASVRNKVIEQLESASIKYKAKFLELPYMPISL